MEKAIQAFRDFMVLMLSKEHIQVFLAWAQPHLQELKRLHFSFSNPLYGLLILVALLLLSRIWLLKKAFSYVFLVTSILYLCTKLTIHYTGSPVGAGVTAADAVRIMSFFAIILITIYYFFVRNE